MRLPDGRIYLDCNATTPPAPEVAAAMEAAQRECFGNPSSPYAEGRAARAALEAARRQVAGLAGCLPEEVVFTGSGTEANHLALLSLARARPGRRRVLLSAVEHPSVAALAGRLEGEGIAVDLVPVTSEGVLDLERLEALLGEDVAAAAVMAAHNETGVLQPVEAVGLLCRRAGAYFHTDAVQAAGKVPLPWSAALPDTMVLAAHKLYGPKGIGALVARAGTPLEPLLVGGGQEGGRRASTEAVPLAAGFGAACGLAAAEMGRWEAVGAGRDRMEEVLGERHGARIHGAGAPRLPNTSFFSLPGVDSRDVVRRLDAAGFAAATGSACHSGGDACPAVLRAMGRGQEGMSALRVSLGRRTMAGEVDAFLAALPQAVGEALGA